MQKKANSREQEKTIFQNGKLIGLQVKRKSKRHFLQTPGKNNYNNVTSFFPYSISLKYLGEAVW